MIPAIRIFTETELAKHTTEATGIYIVASGKVFDVTSAKEFYGPGGGYHFFAGRDASRGLAKSSLNVATLSEKPVGDLSGLTAEELDVLQQWVKKFKDKYPQVGVLQPARIGVGNHCKIQTIIYILNSSL